MQQVRDGLLAEAEPTDVVKLKVSELLKRFSEGDERFWEALFDKHLTADFYDLLRNAFPKTRLILAGPEPERGPLPPILQGRPPSPLHTLAESVQLRRPYRTDFLKWEDPDDNEDDYKRALKEYERRLSEIENGIKQRELHTRNEKQWASYRADDPLSRARKKLQRLSTRFTGRELMLAFFEGTPLVHLYPEPEPETVAVPSDLSFSGTYLLAAQGMGKTTLLARLIEDRMSEPCSIIVFDTKPELSLMLRERVFPKQTVVISPDPYLALNPLDLGTKNLDILMSLFSSLGAGFTTLQLQALRQIVYLTSKIDGASFDTLFDIVSNGAKNYQHIVSSFDPREQAFWQEYPGGQYRDTRGQLIWRLDTISPPESLTRTMFAAPNTKIRLAPLMDTNTLTIIDCTRDQLGKERTEFFGKMFLALIQAAGEQRARSDKKYPCYVIMDEADTIISNAPDVSEMIYRLRSQRIAFVAAHQSLSQIENPKVMSALNDCAVRYVNAKNDAPAAAQHMGVPAEFIRTLKVGEFALSLRGQPASKVKVLPPSWKYPKASQGELQRRQQLFRDQYCYVPEKPKPVPPADDEWGNQI